MKVLWSRRKCLKKFKVFHSANKHTHTEAHEKCRIIFTSCFLSPFSLDKTFASWISPHASDCAERIALEKKFSFNLFLICFLNFARYFIFYWTCFDRLFYRQKRERGSENKRAFENLFAKVFLINEWFLPGNLTIKCCGGF
mgnify:CR=1 FL=1